MPCILSGIGNIGFRQKLNRLDVNAQLAGFRHKQKSFDADKIAVIEQAEQLPGSAFFVNRFSVSLLTAFASCLRT
jgi:hypothetical protein